MEHQRRRDPVRRRAYRVFPLEQPLPELVAALNDFRPAILTGYPSALEVLADEQRAGRLRVHPVVVELGSESVDDAGRAHIATGLGGALHDAYSASECLVMAVDCEHGWLHVNSDWVVLEPVEADQPQLVADLIDSMVVRATRDVKDPEHGTDPSALTSCLDLLQDLLGPYLGQTAPSGRRGRPAPSAQP